MTEKQFAPKDMIFREGDASNYACIVVSGKVEILKSAEHGEIRLAVLEAGAPFGEMGLFVHAPRSATARALEDTVVDIIDADAFTALLAQCPPRLLPLIQSMVERLRTTNARVAKTEQATAVLSTEITEITVSPASPILESQFKAMTVPAAQLPFRIGGYPVDGEPSSTDPNHLYIASEGPPLTVSKNHCEIAIQDGGLYIVDRGSRFGTFVGGMEIGRGKGRYNAPLEKGDNLVTLGGKQSAYQINVHCK